MRVVRPPTRVDMCIVGAGFSGVFFACEYLDAGAGPKDGIALLERRKLYGGVWTLHANPYSRVQTAEPAYRLPIQSSRPGPIHHSYAHELMNDLTGMIKSHDLYPNLYVEAEVRTVRRTPGVAKVDMAEGVNLNGAGSWIASGMPGANQFHVTADQVIFCVNRRLGVLPNVMKIKDDHIFSGKILNGLSNDTVSLSFKYKHVAIIGMGAYAIENTRNGLEQGALDVRILCRRRGTVCPKAVDACNYMRPMINGGLTRPHAGDTVLWESWVRCYESTAAEKPGPAGSYS